jgi:hypothetical protein
VYREAISERCGKGNQQHLAVPGMFKNYHEPVQRQASTSSGTVFLRFPSLATNLSIIHNYHERASTSSGTVFLRFLSLATNLSIIHNYHERVHQHASTLVVWYYIDLVWYYID